MNFVNPITLLQLAQYNISDIDAPLIATAKERLLTEITQTGQVMYRGTAVSPVVCQMLLVELEDPKKLAAYHRIANNAALSGFLSTGNAHFFFPFKWEPMYNDADCIQIISPYFVEAYNVQLMALYLKEGGMDAFKELLAVPLLVTATDKFNAYADLRNNIHETLSTITSIRQTVNDPAYQNDMAGIRGLFKKYLPVDKINLFPPALESLRSRIEKEVHALSISTNDEQLLHITLPFLAALKKSKTGTAEHTTTASESELLELSHYQHLRKELLVLIARIGTKSIDIKDVIQWVDQHIHIDVLNQFSPVFDPFRNQLATDLAALAAAMHARTRNALAAMGYIEMAEQLVRHDRNTLQSLANAKAELQEYAADPQKEPPVIEAEEKAHKPLSTWQIVLLVIFFLRLAFFLYQLSNPTPTYRPITYTSPYQAAENQHRFDPDNFQSIDAHQPATGDAPLEKCFGKGVFNGNAALTIINNRHLSVIVCLYDKKLKRTIRHAYIQQKSDYTIPGLKPGSYTMEIYMGEHWSSEAKNECGSLGAFTSSLVHQHIKAPVLVKAITETTGPATYEINEPTGKQTAGHI